MIKLTKKFSPNTKIVNNIVTKTGHGTNKCYVIIFWIDLLSGLSFMYLLLISVFVLIKLSDFIYIYKMLIFSHEKINHKASLLIQWLSILHVMQRTQVLSVVREDHACHGTINPVCDNYWDFYLKPKSCNYWAHMPQSLKLMNPRAHTLQQEKPP